MKSRPFLPDRFSLAVAVWSGVRGWLMVVAGSHCYLQCLAVWRLLHRLMVTLFLFTCRQDESLENQLKNGLLELQSSTGWVFFFEYLGVMQVVWKFAATLVFSCSSKWARSFFEFWAKFCFCDQSLFVAIMAFSIQVAILCMFAISPCQEYSQGIDLFFLLIGSCRVS